MWEGAIELLRAGLRAQVEPLSACLLKRGRHQVSGDASPAARGENADQRQVRVNDAVAQKVDEAHDLAAAGGHPSRGSGSGEGSARDGGIGVGRPAELLG